MARVSRGGVSRRLSGRGNSLPKELFLQLESQLSVVIEEEGKTLSLPILEDRRLSKRAKRGIRRRGSGQETLVKTKLIPTALNTSLVHPIGAFDQQLVAHVRALKNLRGEELPVRTSSASTQVPVRFSTHLASDHVVSLQLPARPMVEEKREPFGRTIGEWMAPYQIPPSIEGLAAAMKDLWVEELDPRLFLEQFTPGEAHVAYEQQYSWLSKLAAPFVVWEVARQESRLQELSSHIREDYPREQESLPEIADAVLAVSSEEDVSARLVSDPSLAFLSNEQFTSADIESAYRASYGWLARLKRVGQRILSVFDRKVRETEEEVRERVEMVEEEVHEVMVEAERAWGVPVLVPRLHTVRLMASFFGLLLIVTIPAGAVSLSRSFGSSVREVKTQSQAALAQVAGALEGSSDEQAASWAMASDRFRQAREALLETNALALGLAQALPQTRSQYGSAQALLLAGERTSQAARLLVQGLSRALDDQVGIRPDERIGVFLTYLDYASPLLEEALGELEKVDPASLPPDIRPRVVELRGLVDGGRTSLLDARGVLSFLRDALGHEAPRTYLFVFQNHSELRPTGGFMGSVAEIVFDRGEIQHLHVPGGGPYDLRSQLKARVAPPRPLQLVGGRWEFQDANWFPDFPAAAEKIRWFWSQSGQPTLDGIVAVNASMLEDILRITGPIEMPEYGKTLTADNVMFELQKSVEFEYDKSENKPKKIIGDMMPKVFERLKARSREDWLALIDTGLRALETKDVQVWMAREEEEKLVERYDWNGRMKPTVGDALAIIHANIAGQKTDTAIREQVNHEVSIQEDGSIIDTVTLVRSHAASKGELFRGVNNVSYMRVYVPQGSELLEAEGFEAPSSSFFEVPLPEDGPDLDETRLVRRVPSPLSDVDVTEEFGRTAFGAWVQLRPGETRTTKFRYRLPFTVFDLAARVGETAPAGKGDARAAYVLLLTSQPGKKDREIRTRVTLPPRFRLDWTNQSSSSSSGLGVEGTWDRDRVLAGLLYAPL